MSTKPYNYLYSYAGHAIEITRRHIGTAYPRNGNVHNPTEYFTWSVSIDGKMHDNYLSTRWEAYESARQHIEPTTPRFYWIVQAEMKENRLVHR